jgi:hypothetical protein
MQASCIDEKCLDIINGNDVKINLVITADNIYKVANEQDDNIAIDVEAKVDEDVDVDVDVDVTQPIEHSNSFDTLNNILGQLRIDPTDANNSDEIERIQFEWDAFVDAFVHWCNSLNASHDHNDEELNQRMMEELLSQHSDDQSLLDALIMSTQLQMQVQNGSVSKQNKAILKNENKALCKLIKANQIEYKIVKNKRWFNSKTGTTHSSHDTCVICMSEFQPRHLVIPFLPCNHLLHTRCLVKLIQSLKNVMTSMSSEIDVPSCNRELLHCPTCRESLEARMYVADS